jgi:transcription elongation GreA/GreB family factor
MNNLIPDIESLEQARQVLAGEVLPRVVPGAIVTLQVGGDEVLRLQLVEADGKPSGQDSEEGDQPSEPKEPRVDFLKGRISDASPIGKALLGLRVGDKTEAGPGGKRLVVLEVSTGVPLPAWADMEEVA